MAKGKTHKGMAHAVKQHAGQLCRLVMAALVALASAAAQATTWYVSPSGDGTDPSAGFATGFPTIKAALANASLADDDVVLLDRATFDLSYENRAKEIANSGGTISKRIVLSGVGTKEETVIDGGRERNTNGTEWTRRYNDHHPQLVIAVDGVVVQNMTFQRMGSQYHATISLSGHNNCTISNVVIRNTGLGYPNGVAGYTDKAMLYLTGNSNAGNRIFNCVFTNNVSNGPVVWLDGSQKGNRMENCYIAENRCTGVAWNYGVAYMSVGNQYSGGAWPLLQQHDCQQQVQAGCG